MRKSNWLVEIGPFVHGDRRRAWRAGALGVALALLMTACGGATPTGSPAPPVAGTASAAAPAAKDVELTFFTFEGPGQGDAAKAAVAEYQQTHPNVKVTFFVGSNAVEYPKLLAARKTTPDKPLYNIFQTNPETQAKGNLDGMWLSLNTSKMPNVADVIPSYRQPGDKGIGFGAGVIGLMYNTKKLAAPPQSWSEMWTDPGLKGKVVLWDYLWAYNSLPVMARLKGGSEDNVRPGIDFIKQHLGQVNALVTSSQQMQDLLVTGDGAITVWFKGNQKVWASEGKPYGFVVPKEGAIGFPLSINVVAGTTPEQQRAAEDIINLILSPKYQQVYSEGTSTAPTNGKATLPASLSTDPAYSPETLKNAIQLDWAKMAVQNQAWKDLWDREVKAGLAR